MRYISWVRSTEDFGNPPQALMDEMGKAMAESVKNGVIVEAGGMGTLREHGTKLTLTGGKILDGPYSEAKELVGGYVIQNLDSYEEAVEGARWLLELHKEHWPEWEGYVEVRQMFVEGGFDAE
ncbi:YciI family protein [Antrihabitans sp. YC2-6]|uniref:YciI family protein n=1 Tax=Antrihabitans sp. YC2-6 TaxID=2799498 RepID=UPI0018F4BFEA|nr:YciI family protein [Antrihabitans sp. YC2-6]MBJ8343099.1 hypothetical protein [Antrihabitans sp. YC2-6]